MRWGSRWGSGLEESSQKSGNGSQSPISPSQFATIVNQRFSPSVRLINYIPKHTCICTEIVRRHGQPGGVDLPEGVWRTVTGILEHLDDPPVSATWEERLEVVVLLVIAGLLLPLTLYFAWREWQDERKWLKRYRSQSVHRHEKAANQT